MGFETRQVHIGSSPIRYILKQSLWDLKRLIPSSCINKRIHFEAVPMGFETRYQNLLDNHQNYFEAVPMGFETLQAHTHL